MVVTGFNNERSMIKYKTKNIKIQIWDKILTIEEMYNFEFTTKDMLLGMPFLERFYPHVITKTHWWFTTPCRNKIRAKRVNNKQREPTEWIKGSEKINQEMKNINKKQISQLEIIIFTIDKLK